MSFKQQAQITYLKDYKAVKYKIIHVDLKFDFFDDYVIVENNMKFEINAKETEDIDSIELYGANDLKCISIKVDNHEIKETEYKREEEILRLNVKKKQFILSIVTEIYPKMNLSLNGLYYSGQNYFTQNEPHGFRHITFYGDRPDVMTVFKTKITASKEFKYLLSNGNLIEQGVDSKNSNRHYQIWSDPFPKPCYLFALVVGSFDVLKDKFITKSGRSIALELYVDKGKLSESLHAMESLKRSMAWDEQKYNLEYDLDNYMIVAAESFNMGAMENKGLNIFNSKYILGNSMTATDEDLEAIEAVVAHEYFHNWTGNRVTCRDWFQLTLKEGLTVFRDQQFTADQHGEVVKRIKDVQLLRQRQFEEDAGPLAHPIRPTSYLEMNNFYTTTVYEKGAEVIRMLHSIVGDNLFIKSIEKYLKLFDGQAATVEDFLFAFAEVTKRDFSFFMNWYETKGTPTVKLTEERNQPGKLKIIIEQNWLQHLQDKMVELPLKLAWPNETGLNSFVFDSNLSKLKKSEILKQDNNEFLLLLRDKDVELNFAISSKSDILPISFNRGFTSPVYIDLKFNLEHTKYLSKFDNDLFNKWDTCQRLILHYLEQDMQSGLQQPSEHFIDTLSELWIYQLENKNDYDYFTALFLSLPSEDEINEKFNLYHFEEVRQLCLLLQEKIALKNLPFFKDQFYKLKDDELSWSAKDVGYRKLKNKLLDMLIAADDKEAIAFAIKTLTDSKNMNQQFAALCSLNRFDSGESENANQIFIERNKQSSLSIDKWFFAQMTNLKDENLNDKVLRLMQSSYFNIKIPNRVYALVIRWMNNLAFFNSIKKPGYSLMKDIVVQIDQFNPQVASRVLKSIKPLSKLPTVSRKRLQIELEEIYNINTLSKDSLEIVEKFLKG